jgi:cation transport ATPase
MTNAATNTLIQVKASGLMCSFCTMSVEQALRRVPGQVNLVHGIILAEVDPRQVSEADVARKVEQLGYTVVATEAQQYQTDEVIFGTIKRRGYLAMALAVLDLLVDPVNLLSLPYRVRAYLSGGVAIGVLAWVGFPILKKTLLAVRQRVINANVLLSTGAWGAVAIGVGHLVAPTLWPNFFPLAIWLMGLHLFFGYFKLGTRKRAAESVRRLLSLQAQTARVLHGGADAESAEVEVPVAEVRPGEVVAIRPGERVPLDGVMSWSRPSESASSRPTG